MRRIEEYVLIGLMYSTHRAHMYDLSLHPFILLYTLFSTVCLTPIIHQPDIRSV